MTLRIVAKQRYLNQECRNVFYVGGQDATDYTNAQAIVDYFTSTWDTNMAGGLMDSWTLYEFDVQQVTTANQPVLQYQPTGGAIVGDNTSADELPTQIASLLSFRCPTARPNRSRKYLTGFPETSMTQGLWIASHVALVEAFATDLLDIGAGTSLDLDLVVVRLSSTAPYIVSLQNTLTNFVVPNIPVVQRSRRIGSGV